MKLVHICWQPCCPALGSGVRPEALRPALSSGLPFSTNNVIIAVKGEKIKKIKNLARLRRGFMGRHDFGNSKPAAKPSAFLVHENWRDQLGISPT